MAAASPTPLPSYGNGRTTRHASARMMQSSRESPLAALGMSQGFTDNAPMLQSIHVGDSSDDEGPAPSLSKYAEEIIAHNAINSPERQRREPKLRITRNHSASNTPKPDSHITPALSMRIKRVGVKGAPMRRQKRTPQGEEEAPPSQDQENVPMSTMRKHSPVAVVDSISREPREVREERHVPLATLSANTPHRPAPPPPPPKMSVLDTATAAGGASTTKKKRKNHIMVNGKVYSQMGKIGKGGSSDVYRVMAENGKMFALKRVKLEDADESAVIGYKGEIQLLKKLEDVDRVVRLFDWEVEEERQCLSVLMEIGESDLSKTLRLKLDGEGSKFDPTFTRYYWKEMLECVQAVHEFDIVHSDLKPANFLLVQGRLKLIDFGIANAIDIDNTVNVHRDSHVGTPNYMSPESLEDTNAGHRGSGASSLGKIMKLGKPSDVWSLGCILYQMVYGRPPFAHIQSQIRRVMAIVDHNQHIEFPSRGVGDVRVPASLRATLRGCLNRNPALRPSIPDMLDEDDPFLNPDDDNEEALRISQDLLAQIIHRVALRFRDPDKAPPTDEEIRQYPASFYAKIRDLQEAPRQPRHGDA